LAQTQAFLNNAQESELARLDDGLAIARIAYAIETSHHMGGGAIRVDLS
jgi:hypothetical protein